MFRKITMSLLVLMTTAVLATLGIGAGRSLSVVPASASAMLASSCPANTNCLPNPVLITDHATGMHAPFYIEDNEGKPPGQNAAMFWVDGFQVGSVNPVCADATVPYVAHESCLGGPLPGGKVSNGLTGGLPVLGLCSRMGTTDCAQWRTLTAGDIQYIHQLRAAGITVAEIRLALRKLGIIH